MKKSLFLFHFQRGTLLDIEGSTDFENLHTNIDSLLACMVSNEVFCNSYPFPI